MGAPKKDSVTVVDAAKTIRPPRFRWLMPSREFNRLTATYCDEQIEGNYQKYLVDEVLMKERAAFFACTLVYFLYGILDFLVITENSEKIIIVRWLICTPIAIALIGLTYLKFFKPYFTHLITFGVFVASISVVWMIGAMQAENPPPYIVGILAVFIFAACVLHMPFPAAAATFLFTAAAYSATILAADKFSYTDVVSGHFFMTSSALLAIVTNYVQEIRSRIIWRQRTLRERDAKRIEQLLIEATAADQSKINFLSMMSHEMRTPLHQIIGYTELVNNKRETANNNSENPAHLSQIHDSAQTLLARIQKMLRYADTNAGKIAYDPGDNDIRELVDASLEQTCALIEKKRITVDTSCVSRAIVFIDIFHSCYALNNIIENAVNASSADAKLVIYGSADKDGSYELTVEDNGVGMTPEQTDRALRPFTQGGDVLKRSFEGLGLGLTLAQKIFSDQGIVIALESEPSIGTKARIRFPAQREDHHTASIE